MNWLHPDGDPAGEESKPAQGFLRAHLEEFWVWSHRDYLITPLEVFKIIAGTVLLTCFWWVQDVPWLRFPALVAFTCWAGRDVALGRVKKGSLRYLLVGFGLLAILAQVWSWL